MPRSLRAVSTADRAARQVQGVWCMRTVRKRLAVTLTTIAGIGSTLAIPAHTQTSGGSVQTSKMSITRKADRTPTKGPDSTFTGSVSVEGLITPNAPSRLSGASVSFEAGARSAWHTHPLGQALIVTAGKGWIQQEGGERIEISAGDVIWTPPGVKHWHGATSSTSLKHLAIQERLEGNNVQWFQKVTDDEYLGRNRRQ